MEKETKLKKIMKVVGPGFITGASDDDPSGIATYAQTGARFGYRQLWTSVFSIPFMIVMQEMCGRIGLVTGDGLAGVLKKNYSRTILYFVVGILLIANTVNIGADLGAMAAAAQLVWGIPFIYWLIGMTIITLLLEVFVSYPTYSKFLKWLTLSLFVYVIVVFIVQQDWTKIAYSTFVPAFSTEKDYVLNIVAILGTTISPYLFFWQADEEVEEEIKEHKILGIGFGRPKVSRADVKDMRVDTIVGMIFSNLVMFFIIVTFASTLGAGGNLAIETSDQAAQALAPIAGNFSSLLFALGIIGTGLLAVPVLAGSASYAISEAFKWNTGLSKKFSEAHGFYGIITLATLVGLLVNFTPIKPFQMLYYTAVLNGICAPFLMVMVMVISNNKKIMGEFTNSRLSNILGWLIVVVMTVAAIVLFWSWL